MMAMVSAVASEKAKMCIASHQMRNECTAASNKEKTRATLFYNALDIRLDGYGRTIK